MIDLSDYSKKIKDQATVHRADQLTQINTLE